MTFESYYLEFLGLSDQSKRVVRCSYRDDLFCDRLYYHVIASTVCNEVIFSVGEEGEHLVQELIGDTVFNDIDAVYELLTNSIRTWHVQKMFRMTLEEGDFVNTDEPMVQVLSKELLLDVMQDKTKDERLKVLQRKKKIIDDERQFVIVNENKIISYARISDITCQGANIVVWTSEEHRGSGYGKKVLNQVVKWCFDNDCMPIYLVAEDNMPSRHLAKSLGFKTMATEVIISTEE